MGHIGDKKEGVGGGGEVFAQAGLEGGPEMFDGVEVGRVRRQEQQPAARPFHQLLRRRGLMEPCVVQHYHAARGQCGQPHLFKINVHHLRVATALKDQRRDQLVLLGGRNDAGAFPPLARHGFINPFTPGCTTKFTIQAVIHAAFVQVEDGLTGQLFEFAAKEPPLHLVALAIFYEFFLA